MNKNGFMMHPGVWILIAFVLGMILMYLIAKKIIPVPISICP